MNTLMLFRFQVYSARASCLQANFDSYGGKLLSNPFLLNAYSFVSCQYCNYLKELSQVIAAFISIGVVFIPIGLAIFSASESVTANIFWFGNIFSATEA